jgi:hypothetical protein
MNICMNKKFVSRAYNDIQIDSKNLALLVKTSKDERLLNESEYYERLPSDLKIFFPQYIGRENTEESYKIFLEFLAYDNLGEFFIQDREISWEKVMEFLFLFIKKQNSVKSDNSSYDNHEFSRNCKLMYIDKTENEYKNLIENFDYFRDLEKYEEVFLNDQKLLNFNQIWPSIKNYIQINFLSSEETHIHGDLCFSNILCGERKGDIILKFIDPRGSFGKVSSHGDLYYDLAKISHSVNGGYEYFINDMFEIKSEENRLSLIFSNGFNSKPSKAFEEKAKFYNWNKIRILEGTIFIGMCARHYDDEKRQKAMYFTGLKTLNEMYEKILL